MQRFPRLVAALWFTAAAGIAVSLVYLLGRSFLGSNYSIGFAGMVSAAFWAAIIAKPITDQSQACGVRRAAIIGAIGACLSLLTMGVPYAMFSLAWLYGVKGYGSMLPPSPLGAIWFSVRNAFSQGLGLGISGIFYFGWLIIPCGAIAGIVLLKLKRGFDKPVQP